MKKIADSVQLNPQWVQPKTFENQYELRAADQVFAQLEFPKLFGSLAVSTTAEGRWTFKRVGFFKTRITVRGEGDEEDLAVYYPRWTGAEGTLQYATGATYTWRSSNFWATEFVWQDASGQVLITYHPGVEDASISDLFKTQARVEFQPRALRVADLSLLVTLGWYLMILKQQDDTAATSAAATM